MRDVLQRQEYGLHEPVLDDECSLRDAITHMTRRRLGSVLIVHRQPGTADAIVGMLVRAAADVSAR